MKRLLIKVGVRYCVSHGGIANDGDEVCDFHDLSDAECDYRQLFYEVFE